MTRSTLSLIIVVVGILMFSQASLAAGTVKKWKDKNGQWHFGDVIPPEYSQRAHEELNNQGMTVDVQQRAKTDAEIAEEKRQAAIEDKKKEQAEEQARHDRILLDTYTSVDDIKLARDENVASIETRISLAKKRIEKLQKDLKGQVELAAAQERKGKTPSQELKKDIESLHRQLKNQEDFIKAQNKEKDGVMASYEKDMERFKMLKSGKKASEAD